MAPMPSFLQNAAQSSGGEWVRFDDNSLNVPVTGEIAGPYQIRPYKFQGEVQRYQRGPQAGKPKYEMVIPLLVNGEKMNLATQAKYRMENAIATAVQAAGVADLQIGGTLTVTYTGKEVVKGASPAQAFTASYEPKEGAQDAYSESLDQQANPVAEEPAPTYTQGSGFGGGSGAPSGFPGGGQFGGAPAGFPGR